MQMPPVRFVTTQDGVRLACAVYGEGPPLIWVANWLTHLELDWTSPVWKHWLEFLTRHFTLVRYDERGCGLSDWTDEGFDLDHWVADLEAIVDALELERFSLLGLSQGGPIAIEYSVRHPKRVSQLILVGTFPSGQFLQRNSVVATHTELMAGLVETGWGASNPAFRQMFTSLFVPGATEEQRDWFNELQRRSTTPKIAAAQLRAFRQIDVRERLTQVRAPTLVLHARHDAAIPFAEGRSIAAAIPGARLVPLDSDNHIPLEPDPGWPVLRREIAALVGGDDNAAGDASGRVTVRKPDCWKVGEYTIDLRAREVRHGGAAVAVENRAFDLLAYLLEQRDRAVSKGELQTALWPSMILTESALTRCVMKARRAVGDDATRQAVIRTVHGYGYRFTGALQPG